MTAPQWRPDTPVGVTGTVKIEGRVIPAIRDQDGDVWFRSEPMRRHHGWWHIAGFLTGNTFVAQEGAHSSTL